MKRKESAELNVVHSFETVVSLDDDPYLINKQSFYKKYQAYIVVLGALCFCLGVGFNGLWGNYLSYISSLMVSKNIDVNNEDTNYIEQKYTEYTNDLSWTYSIYICCLCATTSVGGKIEYHYGPKLSCIIGSVLILLGLITTFLVCEYTANPYL